MHHIGRKLAALGAGMLLAGGALAQTFPTKPITMLIGFPPGSGNDIIARILTPRMGSVLGQSIVVDNRAGASSNIAMEAVSKSAPDGHTMVLASSSYAINIYTLKGTQPLSAFTPEALIGTLPFVLVVNAKVPAKNVQELIKEVRSHKGLYNAAAGGATGSGFFMVESFKRFVGPELELVVYKGTPEADADMQAGRVHIVFSNVASQLASAKSGKTRFLAVAGAKRNPLIPDVPTFTEQGFPQFDISLWYALLGPAGVPRPVVNQINNALNKALGDKDAMDKLAVIGLDAAPGTPEQAEAFLKQDSAVWAKLVKEAGVTPQ